MRARLRQQQQQQSTALPGLEVHRASDAAELRSAAYLRAAAFYTYPEGRSEFAARSHRRMKGDAEWESVTRKIEGTEEAYEEMVVTCFVATIPEDGGQRAQQAAAELDSSTKLPPATPGGAPRLVVGSLDLNVGAVLPSEALVGRLPQADAATQRAYLSNVCVAQAARRSGVASSLIGAAEQAARAAGVSHLYVHVVADNAPAVALYERAGFGVESEESEGYARSLNRPRRLILHKGSL